MTPLHPVLWALLASAVLVLGAAAPIAGGPKPSSKAPGPIGGWPGPAHGPSPKTPSPSPGARKTPSPVKVPASPRKSPSPSKSAPAPAPSAARIGSERVKLDGSPASGPPKGLLMVDPDDFFTQGFGYVCDDGSFNNTHAAIVCAGLGYPYGRLYVNPSNGNYPSSSLGSETSQFWYFDGCTAQQGSSGGHRRRLRFLLPSGKVQFADGASCSFRGAYPQMNELVVKVPVGVCSGGPAIGIECSAKAFGTAPPPVSKPPSPSPPPPRPPNRSGEVRIVPYPDGSCTGGCNTDWNVEGRVEVLAADGSWAPLCWPSTDEQAWKDSDLGAIVCRQYWDYPYNLGNYFVNARLGNEAIPIGPQGFNPAAGSVKAWASLPSKVFGGSYEDVLAVQQLGLQESATRCAKGLLSIYCSKMVL